MVTKSNRKHFSTRLIPLSVTLGYPLLHFFYFLLYSRYKFHLMLKHQDNFLTIYSKNVFKNIKGDKMRKYFITTSFVVAAVSMSALAASAVEIQPRSRAFNMTQAEMDARHNSRQSRFNNGDCKRSEGVRNNTQRNNRNTHRYNR